MIKYNLNNINKWYLGNGNPIAKMYHGSTVAYDVTGGGEPTPPTPPQSDCYGVTYPSITAYSDTTYSSVYSFTDGKWYMLNNLNQYEEYGVYDIVNDISTATTYEGKLAVVGEIEYQFNNGSWEEVGTYVDASVTYTIDRTSPSPYVGEELLTTFKIPYADVESVGFVYLRISSNDGGNLSIMLDSGGMTEYRYMGSGYYYGTVTNDGEYFYLSLPSEAPQSIVINSVEYWDSRPIHLIVGSKQASVEYEEKAAPSSGLTYSSVADMQAAQCPDVGVGQLCYTDGQVYRFDATEAWVTAQDSEILIKTWNVNGDVSLFGTGYKGGEVAKGDTVTNATDIWIGSGVTYVNYLWSGLYDTLSACTITAVNPPSYSSNSSLPQNFEIKVPCESVHNYRIADGWRNINYMISSIEPSCQTTEYKARLYDYNDNLLVELPRGTNTITSAETQSYKNSTYRVELGDCFNNIYDGAFSGFSHVSSVVIPNNVRVLNYGSFSACINLTSVTISNGVTDINSFSFADCSGLTSVVIPDSVVTHIQVYTFVNCKSLTSVTIGSGVSGIGDNAFKDCSSLTNITILRESGVVYLSDVSALTNTNECPILVPANLVNNYKTATNWKNYANRIQAIPT